MNDIVRITGGSLSYLKRENRKDWWVVDDPYIISTVREGQLVVPKGFETDGASVPRIFWRLMPPMSEYTRIAVIHDFLYRYKGVCVWLFDGVEIETKIGRKRADVIFRDGMDFLDVTRWKIPVMYRAVRVSGPRW